MPEASFGGVGAGPSYSGSGNIFSDGIPLPVGRRMSDGSQACLITAIRGYASGRGGARVGSMRLGSAATGNLTVGASSSAQDTGWHGTNEWLVQGGSTRFQLNFGGQIFYGWRAPGSTNDGGGIIRNGTLGGGIRYATGPSAPQLLFLISNDDGTQIRVGFAGSGDDGGAGLIAYRIAISRNPEFTDLHAIVTVAGGDNTFGGMTPGRDYWYKVCALNRVTELAGQLGGEWSNVGGMRQNFIDPSGMGRVWNGSSWVSAGARVFTPGGWAEADGRLAPNGSAGGWSAYLGT